MKVILTDDSMTIRMILKNLLDELGISDITEGRNGQEALDLLSENRFDLVLIDIHMPKLDGLSVLEKIKTDPESQHKDVPVVIISSDTDYRQLERAKSLGAFGYIKKPFKRESLQAAIKAAQEAEKRKERENTANTTAEEVSTNVEGTADTSSTTSPPLQQNVSQKVDPTVRNSSTHTAAPAPGPEKGGLIGWIRRVFKKK